MALRLLLLVSLCACLALSPQARADYQVQIVAEGLEHPWSLAFLPDGRMLVTERPGRLRVIEGGQLRGSPVAGVPPVFASGQSGLLEVLPAGDFAETGTLFLSFVHGDRRANHTRIVRARFDGERLHDVEPIFTTRPAKSGNAHGGGRLLLLPDGSLLMAMGDGFHLREQAQLLDNHFGKIVRISTDGSVPEDNPFLGREDALPEIYSYGHRHVQGMVLDAASGRVYVHEHGPRGGDELNLIRPGHNYGWPVISHGRDYNYALITPFTRMPGMEQPLLHWTPSIAPSGLALHDGDLFVGALAEKTVRRVSMAGGEPGGQQLLLEDLGERIRDVRAGPDGVLYVLTDENPGRLLRLVPR